MVKVGVEEQNILFINVLGNLHRYIHINIQTHTKKPPKLAFTFFRLSLFLSVFVHSIVCLLLALSNLLVTDFLLSLLFSKSLKNLCFFNTHRDRHIHIHTYTERGTRAQGVDLDLATASMSYLYVFVLYVLACDVGLQVLIYVSTSYVMSPSMSSCYLVIYNHSTKLRRRPIYQYSIYIYIYIYIW